MTILIAGATLGACSKPVEKPEEIRPVRVLVARSGQAALQPEFSGEVRARVESRLAFRVGGKIVARQVDVGTPVKRGQVLMRLDPQDLRLAQAQAGAGLRSAETARDLAHAEWQRYQHLRAQNFVSQAVLDAKESAMKAAQATVDAAQAAYRGQSNQAAYSVLAADVDGVVTAVEAEVGQVVAAGAPVLRVAKAGEKEVLIGLPEHLVGRLRQAPEAQVRLWAAPDAVSAGRLREIAPAADPVTRTFAAKVAMPDGADGARLGMTALVRFNLPAADAAVKVPLTALLHDKGGTAVWLVERGVVKLAPVRIANVSGNDLVLAEGVAPGQTVVIAGVNLLRAGQKVRILEDAIAGAAAPASLASAPPSSAPLSPSAPDAKAGAAR